MPKINLSMKNVMQENARLVKALMEKNDIIDSLKRQLREAIKCTLRSK